MQRSFEEDSILQLRTVSINGTEKMFVEKERERTFFLNIGESFVLRIFQMFGDPSPREKREWMNFQDRNRSRSDVFRSLNHFHTGIG